MDLVVAGLGTFLKGPSLRFYAFKASLLWNVLLRCYPSRSASSKEARFS